MKEVRSIRWTRGAIKHIAKHNIEPFEVEEALFEDKPIIRQGRKDRAYILAQTLSGRYLFIVISYPPVKGEISIITARDMDEKERRLYKKG